MTAAVKPFKVLVVDDEEPVRDFVGRVLRQPSYDACIAASGEEALAAAGSSGPFDLLLTDLAMPGMQGDELARRLRHDTPGIKILYLTGYADRLFEARGLLWEDEAYLDKPVTPQGLLEAVSLMLVGRLPAPRAARVTVPGGKIRLNGGSAELVTLSTTGALIRSAAPFAVNSRLPVEVDAGAETIAMTARIVSSDPVPGDSRHTTAIAFERKTPRALAALERVVRAAS